MDEHRFLAYSEKYLDERGARGESKSQMILKFLEKNGDRAWYSKEIAEALKDKGVKPCDIMTTVRRYERMRGCRTHDSQTPFKYGYLITRED